MRPYASNRIALVLARLILVYVMGKAVLMWIVGHFLGQFAPTLSALLPYDLEMGAVVLSILTLIAAYGFGRERRQRYEADIRRNQLKRKGEQHRIIIPATSEQL